MKTHFGDQAIEIVAPSDIIRRDITIPVKRHVTAINGLLSTPWTALQCMAGRTINAPWGPGEDEEIVNAVLALYQRAGWSVSCATVPSGPNEREVHMTFRLPGAA